MWLSKFLDLTDDVKSLAKEFASTLFTDRKTKKLTPLEFTIIESIFNSKEISGYDLIRNLNEHFAGTWKAKSGTVYPILSKLKAAGFLNVKTVKSPIGPLKKLYYLTNAGEQILKMKVNKNFLDQLKFMENFIIELSSIYIHSFSEEDKEEKTTDVQDLIENTFKNIRDTLPSSVAFKTRCPNCKAEQDRKGASFCAYCGESLFPGEKNDHDDFEPAENI